MTALKKTAPKKATAKKGARKRGRVQDGLKQAEDALVALVSTTKEIYQMVFDARNSKSTRDFFASLGGKRDNVAKMSDKIKSTCDFLTVNCKINVAVEPQSTKPAKGGQNVQSDIVSQIGSQMTNLKLNADKLGCKIIQEV